jgi:hypothetical protein
MTEAEWLACTDVTPMLEFLRGNASERKLRLFACACCRGVWLRLPVQVKEAVATVERYCDGAADNQEFAVQVLSQASSAVYLHSDLLRGIAYHNGSIWHGDLIAAAQDVSNSCVELGYHAQPVLRSSDAHDIAPVAREWASQAALLRDIFDNPFHPVILNPRWLTSTVVALARGIYAERAFDRLPILADALEDAGCDQPDLLAHCRGVGHHVRGCWAVDLILGKS